MKYILMMNTMKADRRRVPTGPHQPGLVRPAQAPGGFTDGVFPEGKEFLAGYWIVDVMSGPPDEFVS